MMKYPRTTWQGVGGVGVRCENEGSRNKQTGREMHRGKEETIDERPQL